MSQNYLWEIWKAGETKNLSTIKKRKKVRVTENKYEDKISILESILTHIQI